MPCPVCKRENPPDARFCAHCGTRLATGRATEERKVVSLLFCDIVDSTALAAARDPEEWRATVRHHFELVRGEIERHGGTVEKFIGDAVMAVFGLPSAHEDDPERSVRAALRILRATSELGALRTRIGIATGEVVADPAAAETGEFLVTGDAVNLAARLQEATAPGTVLIDTHTWRNVHHVVRAEPLTPLVLKGFHAPVEVWQVLAALPDAVSRGFAGLRAPLVGRDEELALLNTVLQRVMRDGRTTLVTVVGDAGVGKSRLWEELRSRLSASVRVLKGRCLPYGSDAAFSALADAVKREAGIEDSDSHEAARLKLQRFTGAALADDPNAARFTAHVIHALGLIEGESPFPITRADVFIALARLLAAMARLQPVVVVLEDVHWADEGLLDFLSDLTLRPPTAHLLLVCLARPLLLERRPDWGGGRRNVVSIYLDPLPPDESRHLLSQLLKTEVADEVTSRVLERAEGNPFFIEEILGMLIDGGQLVAQEGVWIARDAEIRIPDTVQGVIAARLDQLSREEKRVAQDASVVGRIFWLQPLHRLGEGQDPAELIARLERKDLVAERPHSTIRDDREYIFRHLLIRDVAYATIPKVSRIAKHRIVADWLAEVTRDRPDEFADLLAYHYEQAQAWPEAVTHALRLADRVYGLDTYRQALAHYQRAAALSEKVALTQVDHVHLLTQRGWTLARLAEYDRGLADLTQARQVAQTSDAGTWEVQALLGIGWIQGHRDDYVANRETTTQALALARALASPRLVVECLLDLGSCLHNLASPRDALAAFDEAAQVSAAIGYERGTVHAMRGLAMQDVGLLQEAIAYHQQAVTRTREIGERRIEASNLNYLSGALARCGRAQEAAEAAEAAKHLSLTSGDRFREQYARRAIAFACLYLGEFGRAREEGEAALTIAHALKDNEVIGYASAILAELSAHLGDHHASEQFEEEALEAIRRVRTMPGRGTSLGNIGTARLLRRDLIGARAIFQEALSSPFVLWGPPEGRWGLGMVCVREGMLDEAQHHADVLDAVARPRGMSTFLARALWIQTMARGQQDSSGLAVAIALARESRELPLLRSLLTLAGSEEAHEVTETIARSIPDRELRESFFRTPPL